MAGARSHGVSSDFYLAHFTKATGECRFYSWQQLLGAALLEGTPSIHAFQVGGHEIAYGVGSRIQRICPDLAALDVNGRTTLQFMHSSDLVAKPVWLDAAQKYALLNCYGLSMLTYDQIEAQSCLAVNWLEISRYLVVLDRATSYIDKAVRLLLDRLGQGSMTYEGLVASLPITDNNWAPAVPFLLLHRGLAVCRALDTEPLHKWMLFERS
ncbi:hypothetical protein [Salinisphaera aquimarina]|uniref:Uncharacterized protein n=1 Tax=Salinisphaera aquimarina TaxID=2094031 RepID=A0ABV7EQV2_9GAMM